MIPFNLSCYLYSNKLTSIHPDAFNHLTLLKSLIQSFFILIPIPHHNGPSIKLIAITPSINLHQSQESCFISSSHSLFIIPHSSPPFIHEHQFQSTHLPSFRHLLQQHQPQIPFHPHSIPFIITLSFSSFPQQQQTHLLTKWCLLPTQLPHFPSFFPPTHPHLSPSHSLFSQLQFTHTH